MFHVGFVGFGIYLEKGCLAPFSGWNPSSHFASFYTNEKKRLPFPHSQHDTRNSSFNDEAVAVVVLAPLAGHTTQSGTEV
jgi:hypothetical protein